MSVPATSLPDPRTQVWMGALVRVGLAEFGAKVLPRPSPVFAALADEASDTLGRDLATPWTELRARTARIWPLTEGPLGALVNDFDLSLSQTFLLTLVGEVEVSHLVNLALAELQAPAATHRPTVHLCVAVIETLFGPGAVTPQDFYQMSLVQSHVLEVEGDGPMPLRALRVHPSLWAVLSGRNATWAECIPVESSREVLLPEALVNDLPKIASLLGRGETHGLILRGPPGSGRAQLAATLAVAMGLEALEVPLRVWETEPALGVTCRYGGWLPVLRPSLGPGEVWRLPRSVLAQRVVVLLGMDGALETGQLMEVELPLPEEHERRIVWMRELGDQALAADVAATALLSGQAITRVAHNATLIAERASTPVTSEHVAEARRHLGAERLRLLAQPVDRRVTAEALVLSPLVSQELDRVILRCRRRETLWRGLGPTLRATRNRGVRTLFVGESGTGKSLAASYIATALGAPLYRVDLAAVMNKYIGESEKNLAALLDEAAASDVVLLFDEADSLFGKRTDGKETGERYANMLTNFLLTRIESHPGIVLLTTNSRERIDGAFTRRLDMIIEFPLPDYPERLRLWQSHLGERGPGDHTCRYLASYCDLAGGQIRNVVLTAAAYADGRRIEAADLLRGLEGEYRKLGRSLPAKLARIQGESPDPS